MVNKNLSAATLRTVQWLGCQEISLMFFPSPPQFVNLILSNINQFFILFQTFRFDDLEPKRFHFLRQLRCAFVFNLVYPANCNYLLSGISIGTRQLLSSVQVGGTTMGL